MSGGRLDRPSGSGIINHEVCYGALYHAMAKVLHKTTICDSSATGDADPFTNFDIRARDHIHLLYSEAGDEFAVLDTRASSHLGSLREVPTVRFKAVVPSKIFSKRQRGAKRGLQPFPLSINIFGSRSIADDVAYRLSKVSARLQHPQSLHPEIEYHNPQFLTFDDDNLDMQTFIGIGTDSPWSLNVKISEELGKILESLAHADVAAEKPELPTALTSTLKSHQVDGLRFILQRENEAFSQQLSARLRQVVKVQNKAIPSVCLGGLIADVMGLGKTLSMLTAILHSMPAAANFSYFYDRSEDELINGLPSKATLVIVSSAQLLESWVSEIQAHFCPGALSYICFHGQNRTRDSETLRSVDLVLTTYATLAKDYAGQRILYQMEWYRAVLDEAHWIRNSGSKQFQAAAGIHTRKRWCLTGTPIQNKLDDLVSLAQFLQLPHLSTKTAFQKHIISPLSEGGLNFAKPLRAYLEAYCLRRSEKCLSLPPSRREDITLRLSSEEQRLYDLLLHETRKQIDSLVSKGANTSSKLFTAMVRMRMLCNLGTFSSARASVSFLGPHNSETGCERCSVTDEDGTLVLLEGFSFCPECGRPLLLSSPLIESADSQGSDTENNRDDASIILNTATRSLAVHTIPSQGGFSTKLDAVVQNVKRSGPDTKSIVFSYWTSTLDLLSGLLKQANIPHRLVDGRVSYAERSKSLGAFKEEPGMLVLLMSIGTGALGLNLTVSNRVHIVEPQWNPSVEEQAIARALRMGQTREVTIVRYLMENTVEQNIINLQQKKKNLAKFTFGTGTESLSGTIEDLKVVLGMGST